MFEGGRVIIQMPNRIWYRRFASKFRKIHRKINFPKFSVKHSILILFGICTITLFLYIFTH